MPSLWTRFAGVLVVAAALGATSLPAQPIELSPDATLDDVEVVVGSLTTRVEEDGFAAVRSEFESLIARRDLPVELRSPILRAAVTAARGARDAEFQELAERYAEGLVDQLPAGGERSRLLQSLAVIAIDRGEFARAEEMYLAADADATERPLPERANLMTGLGVARAQQGNLDGALQAMLEGYARYEQTEEGPSANLLRNIGGLSIYLGDFEQSVEFTRQAIDVLGPDDPTTPGAYSNLAAALVELGRTDDALEALQTGIALADRQGRPNSALLSNLGFIQLEQGRYDEALATFERTEAINRADSDTSSLAITVKNIGDVHVARGERELAAETYERSLALYREADIKPKRLELYEPLVENLEALGRYPEALERMREWQDLAAELASADAQTRVAEMQTVFDLQQRERELGALQAEQERQRRVRWLLLAGVGVLGLFLLVLVRSLRMRTRANRLLAEKNAEIDVQRRALAEANALLHRQSHQDELTGLENRRSIRRLLSAQPPPAVRRAPCLVLLIDLDRFKEVNDRFGHPAGDRVLAKFADLLREVAGPDDALARWGGEEFLWLVAAAGVGDAARHCTALLERVRREDVEIDGQSVGLTCSIGVAPADLDADPSHDEFSLALKVADAALYEAKQNGRDRWVAFDRRAQDENAYAGTLDLERLIDQGDLVRIED